MIFNKKEDGFTLSEILVVILVFSLFATLTIPTISKYMKPGDDDADKLYQWLKRRQFEASLSSYPMRICLVENELQASEYKDNKWINTNTKYKITNDVRLTSSCEINESECCFIINSDGLASPGSFIWQQKGKHYGY